MESPITMDNLPLGRAGQVRAINAQGGLRRRMLDLGLVEGTDVEALHRGPWGDPTAYLIRGAVIALRDCDAAQIEITGQRPGVYAGC